jgi:ABC-type branched-subunit amino acid transport system substrate-binding protein
MERSFTRGRCGVSRVSGLQSRRATYSTLVGIGVGVLVAGLVVPFVAGEPVDTGVAAISSPPFPAAAADSAAASAPAGGVSTGEGGTAPSGGDGAGAAAGSSAAGDPSLSPAPGDPAASGGDPGRPAPAGTPGAAPLRATDVGVSATEIRLGFVLINVGPASQLGTVVGIEVEQQRRAVTALIDDLNRRGGVHGRTVIPVFAEWDVLDASAGRRVCVQLTEDGKVFAATGALFPPDVSCYTREHGTYLQWVCQACPDSAYSISRGLMWTTLMRGSRLVDGWMAELDRVGFLDLTKVGIVTDDTNDPGGEAAQQLTAVLRARGREVVRVSRLSADLQTGSSQIPVEVNQHRAAGAEAVLLLPNRIYATQFVQQADSQGWRPRWSTSVWGSLQVDTCCENMPNSFDGALGVNTSYNPEEPEAAPSRACREFHDRATGTQLGGRTTNEYSLTMQWCDTIGIFERAATAAGPELTRASYHAAIEGLGDLGALAGFPGGRLQPGKVDLGDLIRLQRWQADCRCWRPAGGYSRVPWS